MDLKLMLHAILNLNGCGDVALLQERLMPLAILFKSSAACLRGAPVPRWGPINRLSSSAKPV